MKRRIRIQGALIFFAVIIIISLSKFVFPHWKQEPLDEFLDALGIGLVLFGFLFRIASRGYKEEKSCGGKNLVKDGPYALLRHPMYFGTLMIGTGIICVLLELWILPLFLIIFVSIYIPQIKKEENRLYRRFGEEYKNYCKTSPKYFPSIYHLSNIIDHISLKFSWIRKELFPLIAVVVILLAIEIWEDVRLFGYIEFFEELLELSLTILSFIIIVILFIKKYSGKMRLK